jgi:imidazolonepropionase-like amidohydrolase
MKNLILLLAGLLVAHPAIGQPASTVTAFVNVNVVPMTSEHILLQQTVLVDGETIFLIGDVDTVPVPEGAQIVDGTDRFLMPGLAEMHAHIPGADTQSLSRVLTLFVANGVTTTRGMLGQPSHLRLRQQLLDGEVFGPRLVTSGPSFSGNTISGPEDAVRKVKSQHTAGYDFIKLHPGLSADEFAAIADTANSLEMPFAGHVPVAVGVENVLAANMATIDHLDGYFAALIPPDSDGAGGYGGFGDLLLTDEAAVDRIAEIAAETARAGTWNVPTQSLFEHRVSEVTVADLRNRPEMRYMPESTVNEWAAAKERQLNERGFDAALAARAIKIRRMLILALHEAGAGLLAGSDAPQVFNVPGFSLHRELGFMVASGLTPYETLQASTTAAAEFLQTNAGAVTPGRDADLVLLNANPLEDISNIQRIHGVMLRGSWYSAAELDDRLEPFRR